MSNFSSKSRHDQKYFKTVSYAYIEENFGIKLIFENKKTSINTKEKILH